MNKEEEKEVKITIEHGEDIKPKLPEILEKYTKDGRFNFGEALNELDIRVKMLEEAMVYLAEIEKKKLGIYDSTNKLILPDNDIVTPIKL